VQQELSIAEMAADYVRELRTVQPKGPYFLCGQCTGGMIAFEMARQLDLQGDKVGFVGLINVPFPPSLKRGISGQIYHLLIRSRFTLKKLWRLKMNERLPYARYRASVVLNRALWVSKTRALQTVHKLTGNGSHRAPMRLLGIPEIMLEAMKSYAPEAYGGRITFFLSQAPLTPLLFPTVVDQWSHVAKGGVQLITIPGDDDSVYLEPNVSTMTEKLRQCIAAGIENESDGAQLTGKLFVRQANQLWP
jgi:thioesterase domain-containing protein